VRKKINLYSIRLILLIYSTFIHFSCNNNSSYKIKFNCENKKKVNHLTIFFEEYFNEDTIYVMIDNKTVYKNIVSSSLSLSLADYFEINNFYKKNNFYIIINKHKIKINPKKICGKVLIVNYINDTIFIENKDTPNLYY